MIKRCLKILCFIVLLVGMVPMAAQAEEIVINDEKELCDLLNDTGTQSGTYRLNADIMIDTNDLRKDPAKQYSFNGNLNGDGHTITVSSSDDAIDPFAPLFDTLRGSVSNLNVVFEGDVAGAPFAYDILDESDSTDIALSKIHVTIRGNVLPAEHNYLEHKGYILNGNNYGNWYIHFGGQPAYLSAGFAWYIWGASLSDITLDIFGNVGASSRLDKDATATGFAYFALLGDHAQEAIYDNIAVNIEGNIQCYTGEPDSMQSPYICAYASAYGFATGTFDNSMMGGKSLTRINQITVRAGDIIADSMVGGSTASGFAKTMTGDTYSCEVDVKHIRSIAQKESSSVHLSYTGQAVASGFAYITSYAPFDFRGNFENNTVTAESIYAETNSTNPNAQAYATGFINELAGAAAGAKPLYSGNQVNISNNIIACANYGVGISSGFVRLCKNRDKAETFRDNSVSVGGNIHAQSKAQEGSAAGFVYSHYATFRNCDVEVGGSIISQSPTQAISGGFTTLGHLGNAYSIEGCDVHIGKDIQSKGENEKALTFSGGLIGYVNGGDGNSTTKITDNIIKVDRDIKISGNNGLTGLVVGFVSNSQDTSRFMFERNKFVGKEILVNIHSDDEKLYTNYIGQMKSDILQSADNSVQFIKPDGRKYTASVKPIPDQNKPDYVLLWELTDIQEVIQQYTITAAAGEHGTITPNGTVTVDEGSSQSFSIVAEPGYHIKDVVVNGQSVGAVDTYVFENIQSNGIIDASFEKDNTGGGVVDTYTLRYDTNGGAKIVSESKSAAWVKAYDELPVPIKEGAVFAGWYWDKALNKPVEDDVKINRSLVTLYAKWEKNLADPDNTGASDWLDTVNHHAYLGGYPDNTFGGERDMTRAEVAQMFYNLLLNKNVPITVRFDDVAEDAWYTTAVNTLASLDILQGVGDNNFAPQRSITRAEFTCIAMRFAVMDAEGENVFSDVNETDWFYNDIVGSIKYGWIGGYPDGTFRPNNTITRAEVTAITNRMLGRQADQAYINHHVDELRQFIDVDQSGWAYYDIMEATNAHEYHQESGEELWSTLL